MEIIRGESRTYAPETRLFEIAKDYADPAQPMIVGALVDHNLEDLQNVVGDYQRISFVRTDSETGRRIYRRSVVFVLIMAVRELFPTAKVIVEFTAHKGLYCTIEREGALCTADVHAIEQRMREIVRENRPIEKKYLSRNEMIRLYQQEGQYTKAEITAMVDREQLSLYYCGDHHDYLYGPMVGETGMLEKFAVDYLPPGILLRTPSMEEPETVTPFVQQPKFSNVLIEAEHWANVLRCDYVTDLNRHVREGGIRDIIHVSEALHEKKIAEIANHIAKHIDKLRIILIAGPSSSGKTSFAQRLRIQLRANGIEPRSISLDDYFKHREETPRTEAGAYDFESLRALEVDLFNKHLIALLRGEEIVLPKYNFLTGRREEGTQAISLGERDPIIIEGIHGLNEELTRSIPRANKYKIYISALTQLNIDAHNRIATTDARLLRRLVRDYQFRGAYALKTLKQWPDVRAGEEMNIFPFQEEADVMFNSALIYELGVLKRYATPLLEMIPQSLPAYAMAQNLLDICNVFAPIDDEEDIPNNSLLREFIGKSIFFR